MKIMLYSSTSRTREGGVQGVYASLASGLRRRGHEVVEAWSTPAEPPNPSEWTAPLHLPRTWRGLPRPRSVVASGWSVFRLLRGLRQHRPDVVHLHFVRFEAVYFLLLRSLLGHRVVLTFHGSDLQAPDRVSRRVLPLLIRLADAVAAVSPPLRARLERMTVRPEGVALVQNGVDVDFWGADTRVPSAKATVVAVGRLERVKGFDVLIEAVRRLRETQDVRLRLVGDGQERGALERQVAEAGLTEGVTFAGHLGAEGVREAFRSASVFALPSRSEGLPLAVLEAMSAGLPVVATRVGGVPGLVSPSAGAVVAPEDPAALADALRAYLSDSARAAEAGRAGRDIARAYSDGAMTEAYERLYERARSGGRSGRWSRVAAGLRGRLRGGEAHAEADTRPYVVEEVPPVADPR